MPRVVAEPGCLMARSGTPQRGLDRGFKGSRLRAGCTGRQVQASGAALVRHRRREQGRCRRFLSLSLEGEEKLASRSAKC